MAQVGTAIGAADFSAHHAVAGILVGADGVWVDPLPKAGPARAGIKLGVGAEELSAAANAAVHAITFVIPVGPSKSAFSPAFACDAELFGSQFGAPVVLACFHGLIIGSAQR